jgi:hypothetical protein
MPQPARVTRIGHQRQIGSEQRNLGRQDPTAGLRELRQVAQDSGDQT